MESADRRTFLRIAGAGGAAAGAAVLVPAELPAVAGATAVAGAGAVAMTPGAAGALAAFVSDVSRGEVVVMVEGREVLITDHQIVARLANAIHGSSPR